MIEGSPYSDTKTGLMKVFIVETDDTENMDKPDFIGKKVKSIARDKTSRIKTIHSVDWRGTTKKGVKGLIVLCEEDRKNGDQAPSTSNSEPGDQTAIIQKLNHIETQLEEVLKILR